MGIFGCDIMLETIGGNVSTLSLFTFLRKLKFIVDVYSDGSGCISVFVVLRHGDYRILGSGTVNPFHRIYLCGVSMMSFCKLFVNTALV